MTSEPNWPRLIPLGAVLRPPTVPQVPLSDVAGPADLPDRFWFGDIDASSFRAGEGSWSVSFEDAELAAGIDLSFRNGTIQATGRWPGVQPFVAGCAARTIGEISPYLATSAARLDPHLKAELEKTGNLFYVEPPADASRVAGVPDGLFFAVHVPLRARELSSAADWLAALDASERPRTPITAYARLSTSVVNYPEASTLPNLWDPYELMMLTTSRFEMPLQEVPVVETGTDGSRAITVRRIHYSLIAHVAVRDLPRVVTSLRDADLISPRSMLKDSLPLAGEDSGALVAPAAGFGQVSYWSETRKCYVHHYGLDHPELGDRPAWLHEPAGEETRSRIATAERGSREYMSQIQRDIHAAERESTHE